MTFNASSLHFQRPGFVDAAVANCSLHDISFLKRIDMLMVTAHNCLQGGLLIMYASWPKCKRGGMG